MTRLPQTARRGWMRRTLVGALLVSATAVATAPATGGAAPKTSSDTIAAEASRALDALTRWEQTRHPVDFVHFVQRRDVTARMVATDIGLDAGALSESWASAPTENQHVVLAAMSQLGVPYRSMRSEAGVGFDCSGLTIWAYAQAGIEIPRSSGDQISAAEAIDVDEAEPGDLVYYPGHVGLFLGAGGYLHSPNSGNDVEATYLPTKSLRYGDATQG